MSSAVEILNKNAEASKTIEAYNAMLGGAMDRMIDQVAATAFSREVCAKRARKLRKRGEIISYSHRSKTGKARYKWGPFPDWSVML